jgi:HEPN domain-containing protein
MSDLEHARLMVTLSRNDLAVIEVLQESSGPVSAAFGFHAQQAVEKALKAWLSLLGAAYPRTHSLQYLFELLADGGASVATFRHLQDLSPFAVQYRYEALDDLEEPDRPKVIRNVRELIEFVEQLVSGSGTKL